MPIKFPGVTGSTLFEFGAEGERDQVNSGLPGDSIAALTFQTFQDFLLGLPGCSAHANCRWLRPDEPRPGTNGSSVKQYFQLGKFFDAGRPKGPRLC